MMNMMNMIKKYLILLIIFIFQLNAKAEKPTLYLGAKVYVGNGTTIENALVSVNDGKFELISEATNIRIDPNAFDTIIRVDGKYIYPAFILPNTTLGLREIDAVKATKDFKEIGKINPNVRSLIAYNTDSKITPTIRTNGILIAQITPRGSLFSGQSSIFYLDGDNWENAVYKSDDGIHLNWPSSYKTSGWWANPGETKKFKDYEEVVSNISEILEKAKSYSIYHKIIDLRMESLKGLFNGSKTLYIHADYARDIRKSILFCLKIGVKKIVLVGGEEALQEISLINKNKIPIILNRIHRLPPSQDINIFEPFLQPKKLQENGVLFCFSYSGEMEAMGARNLPFTAGSAVSYGLKYDDAISSLTLNAAKILGIDDKLGSIEIGKEASFFISTGDALDIKTNNVELAIIKGKIIDLNNHQKNLYNKYKRK